MVTDDGQRDVAHAVDQSYYWQRDWQVDERLAVAELARGEGREFESAADATRWLLSADERGCGT